MKLNSFLPGLPSGRRWLPCLLVLLLCLPAAGCLRQILLLGYLIGGPPTIEPDFDTKTKISLSTKGRKVAILCYAPKEVKWDFDAVDREMAKYVSHRLSQNHIKVIDPDVVQAWLDETGDNWDRPTELGKDLEADFVIFIQINDFGLYEEGSQNNLFRGHSEALITVHEMEGDEGNEIYSKELLSKFPIHQSVSTSDISFYDFKRMYLSRLSDEIGRHFYEHEAGDEIPNGALNPLN